MSNSHELSHLMSAFRTSDRGFRREMGHHCLAYSQLSRTSITE